jgi:hypothetical protein
MFQMRILGWLQSILLETKQMETEVVEVFLIQTRWPECHLM